MSPRVCKCCKSPSVTMGHDSGALSTQLHGWNLRHRAEREKPDLTAADAMLGVEAPPKCGAHECDLLGSGAFADVIS